MADSPIAHCPRISLRSLMLTPRFPGFLRRNLFTLVCLVLGAVGIPSTASAQVPVITSAASAGAPVGEPFSYQITATNSPFSFSATGLPAGLSVNVVSGRISGNPTSAGIAVVALGASNASGLGVSQLSITVTPYVQGKVTTVGRPPKSGPSQFGVGKLQNDRPIVGGGSYQDPATGTWSVLNEVYELNTIAKSWGLHSLLNSARLHLTIVPIGTNRLLTSSSYNVSGTELYDGSTWSVLSAGPSGNQGGQILATLADGRILQAGNQSSLT